MKKKKKQNKHIKKLKYFVETILAYGFYYLFQLIPVVWSSKLGYFLGKKLVPLFVSNRKEVVISNIQRAFPDKSSKEVEEIFIESCGVFVATIFEIPRVKDLVKRTALIDKDNTLDYMKDNKSLVFSAHIGNWEIFVSKFFSLPNKSFSLFKKPKNYFLEKLFYKLRYVPKNMELVVLDRKKVLYLNNQIKNHNVFINMMVDQKIKEGIQVDLLGRSAYTSTFFPLLAFKYNLPLTPVHVVRKPNCKFEIILEKPIDIERTGDKETDIKNLTILMNKKIEEWIKENPSQWLWLHKRW